MMLLTNVKTCAIERINKTDENGYENEIREYTVMTAWFFYVMMAIFSVLDNLEMVDEKDDFFYRMENPPNVETERSMYLYC